MIRKILKVILILLFPVLIYPQEISANPEIIILSPKSTDNLTVGKRAGFLLNDGTVVDLDGSSPLVFTADEGDYYVVVEHRNHLPIMSSAKVNVAP